MTRVSRLSSAISWHSSFTASSGFAVNFMTKSSMGVSSVLSVADERACCEVAKYRKRSTGVV